MLTVYVAQDNLEAKLKQFRAAQAEAEADDDVRESGDLRPRAAEAHADYLRGVKRVAVPRVMTSTGECFYGAPASQDENTLIGAPVSPGVYEGAAHIVETPVGAQLEHGEILVMHSTDPSWTPLFLNAGAVIMETGGPISHGAIVARECAEQKNLCARLARARPCMSLVGKIGLLWRRPALGCTRSCSTCSRFFCPGRAAL